MTTASRCNGPRETARSWTKPRALRDRYIEQINKGLLLPPSACGKYDVSGQLDAAPTAMKIDAVPRAPLLEAA